MSVYARSWIILWVVCSMCVQYHLAIPFALTTEIRLECARTANKEAVSDISRCRLHSNPAPRQKQIIHQILTKKDKAGSIKLRGDDPILQVPRRYQYDITAIDIQSASQVFRRWHGPEAIKADGAASS